MEADMGESTPFPHKSTSSRISLACTRNLTCTKKSLAIDPALLETRQVKRCVVIPCESILRRCPFSLNSSTSKVISLVLSGFPYLNTFSVMVWPSFLHSRSGVGEPLTRHAKLSGDPLITRTFWSNCVSMNSGGSATNYLRINSSIKHMMILKPRLY